MKEIVILAPVTVKNLYLERLTYLPEKQHDPTCQVETTHMTHVEIAVTEFRAARRRYMMLEVNGA